MAKEKDKISKISKRNSLLIQLKDELNKFIRENLSSERICPVLFEFETTEAESGYISDEFITISKIAETIDPLTQGKYCNNTQRFLKLAIAYISYQEIHTKEEDDEVCVLIEQFLSVKAKELGIKINLNDIGFDFENTSSNLITFTTTFDVEISYLLP